MADRQSLSDAISSNIGSGDLVFLGGFGHGVPFAAGHEIIRQRIDSLTLCRSGADILVDQMIASGCVARLIFGWIGNPGIGLAHAFRRALEKGDLQIEEWTNWSLVTRLLAGQLGLPFLPARVLQTGDTPRFLSGLANVICPYTTEKLTAIPALNPDVAIIHAHAADSDGNLQLLGPLGDTVVGALASRKIVATVESVVDSARDHPSFTSIPGYRVNSITLVPFGSHPSYMHGLYWRDNAEYERYETASRSEKNLDDYLQRWVFGPSNRDEYLDLVETESLSWRPVPRRSNDATTT